MRTDGQVSRAGAHLIASDDTDVEALRAEVTKWQERVPKLVSVVRERTQELESLKARNANLAETTEFASQQIESLSRELSRLVEQNDHQQVQLRQMHDQQKALELKHEQRECELTGEVQRLNNCIEQAQHSHTQLERERRALAEQVATLEQALLEAQRGADTCKDFDQPSRDAEREAQVNQKHALCTLEDELYLLKCELDEQPWPEADDASAVASEQDRDDMPAKLLELEQMLRERTEQLDNLRRSRHRADLTVLKGVGVKVAEQLAGLGYGTLEAIARLETSDLENEGHPLHSFKSRIARDDWIGRAKAALED